MNGFPMPRSFDWKDSYYQHQNAMNLDAMANYLPKRTIPAGTEWERTGGNQWRVTIRREPEVVPDYGVMNQQLLNAFAPHLALQNSR